MVGPVAAAAMADEAAERRLVRQWHEWEVDGATRSVVLVIATDLEMRAGHDDFDSASLDALIELATARMRSSPSPIDRIRIVPADPA